MRSPGLNSIKWFCQHPMAFEASRQCNFSRADSWSKSPSYKSYRYPSTIVPIVLIDKLPWRAMPKVGCWGLVSPWTPHILRSVPNPLIMRPRLSLSPFSFSFDQNAKWPSLICVSSQAFHSRFLCVGLCAADRVTPVTFTCDKCACLTQIPQLVGFFSSVFASGYSHNCFCTDIFLNVGWNKTNSHLVTPQLIHCE